MKQTVTRMEDEEYELSQQPANIGVSTPEEIEAFDNEEDAIQFATDLAMGQL